MTELLLYLLLGLPGDCRIRARKFVMKVMMLVAIIVGLTKLGVRILVNRSSGLFSVFF